MCGLFSSSLYIGQGSQKINNNSSLNVGSRYIHDSVVHMCSLGVHEVGGCVPSVVAPHTWGSCLHMGQGNFQEGGNLKLPKEYSSLIIGAADFVSSLAPKSAPIG